MVEKEVRSFKIIAYDGALQKILNGWTEGLDNLDMLKKW